MKRLLSLLETGRLTREEVAQRIGVTPDEVDDWATGHRSPSAEESDRLEALFGPYTTPSSMEVRAAILLSVMNQFGWECSTLVPKKKKLDS